MLQFIIRLWQKYNPFDIDVCISAIKKSVKNISAQLDLVSANLDYKIDKLSSDLSICKTTLHTIGDTIPDMMWFKSVNGVYLYANTTIKTKLLFDMYPIGKTDIQMAAAAKELFGDANHTFGAKCANSDKLVIETLKPQRFLESGMIEGKMVYLEVYKAPVFLDGMLVGVCGTGRDMTEYVTAYRTDICGGCSNGKMHDIFSRYEYIDGDTA